MPVLHRYRDGSGHYAKAHIRGKIVTFQLTEAGVDRLRKDEVEDGGKFPLRQLFDLVHDRHAYTGAKGGSGRVEEPSYYEAEQFEFEFDFEDDRVAETAYPQCEETGSLEDLHLVTHGSGEGRRTRLLSAAAREPLREVGLSLPLGLIDAAALDYLLATGSIVPGASCLERIRAWLDSLRYDYWSRRTGRPPRQGALDLPAEGELQLR